MKRLLIVIVVLLAIGGGAYYYLSYGQEVEEPEIISATVSRGGVVEAVDATGTLGALRTVQVGSQVSGIVQHIYADFNSIVTEGQLIAELDPSLLQVQVDIQEANIRQRETDIANQKVQLADAELNLRRTQQLFEKGLTNQQQLEAADLAVKNRVAQIASAETQLASQTKNLEQARLNVSYTKIYSPIDGVVVQRLVDEGQAVQSSMTTPQFFTLATDLRQLKLTGGVDEADIGKIRPGQDVVFQVDAYGEEEFYGVVNSVRLNASVQSNVVTYPVWIDAPNPDLKLRPSMTANLKIIISTVDDVMRVPTGALRFRPNEEIYLAFGLTPPRMGEGMMAGGRAGGRGADALADNGDEVETHAGDGRGRGGGRVGGQPQRTKLRPSQIGPQRPRDAELIDERFTPVPRTTSRGTVWTWNEETGELRGINLTLGISDGQWSELVSGDVAVGDEIITGVILPGGVTAGTRQTNPFQSRGFRGMGGDHGR
jgi:HlyD family secretion protein